MPRENWVIPVEKKIRSLTMMEAKTLTLALRQSIAVEGDPGSNQTWASEIMLEMIPNMLYQEKP